MRITRELFGGGSGHNRFCGWSGFGFTHLSSVDLELRCPGELSEFVTNHLLCDVDWEEVFSVVDGEGESYELWWDVTVTSPSFDDLLLLL